VQYSYPDGANIGNVSKQKIVTSGEEVQYQYDSLGRMISAATTAALQGPVWAYSQAVNRGESQRARTAARGGQGFHWQARL
jgi:hypothetical protein